MTNFYKNAMCQTDARRKWLLKKWTITKNPSHKKITSSPDSFTNKFYQLKEKKKKVSIFIKLLHRTEKDAAILNFFCGSNMTLLKILQEYCKKITGQFNW